MEKRIVLTFLDVPNGKEIEKYLPQEIKTPGQMTRFICDMLTEHADWVMIAAVEIRFDDSFEIIAKMTEADPLAGLSIEGAQKLIEDAKAAGYSVDPELTPELAVSIYYDMYPEVTEED